MSKCSLYNKECQGIMNEIEDFEMYPECFEGESTTIRIDISSGRTLNLLKDDLTTQDMRAMSGVEVRMIRRLQEEIRMAKGVERSIKIYEETGLLVAFD